MVLRIQYPCSYISLKPMKSYTKMNIHIKYDIEYIADMCIIAYSDNDTDKTKVYNKESDQTFIYELKDNVLYIAFRGTDSLTDVKYDINVSMISLDDNVKFHRGLYEAWKSIECYVMDIVETTHYESIVLCGHSLGGGLCHIGAYHIINTGIESQRITSISFGAPQICNRRGNDWFKTNHTNSYRYIHKRDPVVYLPMSWRFSRDIDVYDVVSLTKLDSYPMCLRIFRTNVKYHRMASYTEHLKK